MTLKVGDKVVYKNLGYDSIYKDGQTYTITKVQKERSGALMCYYLDDEFYWCEPGRVTLVEPTDVLGDLTRAIAAARKAGYTVKANVTPPAPVSVDL